MNISEKIKRPYIWLTLIATLHVPLLLAYYKQLWTIEHYQFYPFALLSFVGLAHSRRTNSHFSWQPRNTSLLIIDLLLLTAGIILSSPWLVVLGAIFLCLSICLTLPDSTTKHSLGYLVLLPLITLRLPLQSDLQVINWLQRVTTSVGSNVLNFFGYLHLREGNILEFPRKRFLVEEACSGVQSLFALLFLAALIICVCRRRWLPSMCVFLSAFCFAGVMNVLRVTSISMAWISQSVDLASGWQHDMIGYIALMVAALLVFSTDAFLSLIFAPVPEKPGEGRSAVFRNPLAATWNRLFEHTSQKRKGLKPRLPDYFKPRNILGWTRDFLINWFSSRQARLLPLAILFTVVGFGGAGFLWSLETSPQNELVAKYEQALLQAATLEDAEQKTVYLRSLIQLRQHDNRYRFQLAMHLLDCDKKNEALAEIAALTTPGRNDFLSARLWLAKQALSETPTVPLLPEQIEGHLLMALKTQPKNAPAKQMLAEVFVQKGHLKGAEDHLMDLVHELPEVALALARIQTQLGRSQDTVNHHLDTAIKFSQARVMQNPTSVADRVTLAEALVLAKQLTDAERVLTEGRAASPDSRELQVALAGFYGGLAATRIKESLLNRDLCAAMLTKAIQLTPENQKLLRQALTLSAFGAKFLSDDLQPAIAAMQEKKTLSTNEKALLVQTLAAVGNLQRAIEILQPLTETEPHMNIVMARLLKAADQPAASQQLVARMLTELKADSQTASVREILEYVDVLNLADRREDALSLMTTVYEQSEDLTNEETQQLNLLCGQTSLALYDRQLSENKWTSGTVALALLKRAWKTNAVSMGVLQRLATLSCSDNQYSSAADGVLNRLLTESSAGPEVYNLVGTKALQNDQIQKARRYLESAFNLNRNNPMVLNNLALALVRDEGSNTDRALIMVESALKILPDHPDVLSTRAEVFMAMERWQDARRDLERSSLKQPQSVDCRLLLAQVCDAMGEASLAEQHRQRIRELQGIANQ